MTSAERQRRFLARIRERAAASAAAAPAPTSPPVVAPTTRRAALQDEAAQCSFCGKTAERVGTMVVSNGANICNECVGRAIVAIGQSGPSTSVRAAVHSTRWLRQMLGNRATRALIDGFTQALADQNITSERDE